MTSGRTKVSAALLSMGIRLISGAFEQVVHAVEFHEGLLDIFRAQPEFQSHEIIETPSGLVSALHWISSQQANAAARVAASRVAAHLDDLVKLQQSDVGEVVLSSLVAAR